MHNRQMVLSKAECRGIFREHAALSKGSNPKWSRKSHLDRLGPVPNGISCFIWKSARIRTRRRAQCPRPPQRDTGRRRRRIPQPNRPEGHTDGVSAVRRPRPRTAPPAPPESECRERKGTLFSEGPLGDLEAKPGFEPGVKALQASALPLGHFAVDMKRADSKTGPMHAMERTTGLEPATPTLARLCSTN